MQSVSARQIWDPGQLRRNINDRKAVAHPRVAHWAVGANGDDVVPGYIGPLDSDEAGGKAKLI